MFPLIPTLTGKFSGQRFVERVGALFDLIPPPPQQVVVAPGPLTDGEAIIAAWQQVGDQMQAATRQVADLVPSGPAVR